MKLFKFVLLCLFLISPVKADAIYELIKIPNLEIYNIKTENKLRYLNAKQAFTIGIDNNIFVDICHWNIKPLDYSNDKKEIEVLKTVVGNRIVQDGKVITDWTNSIEIYPNLYQFKKTYPTKKQMKRIYKSKPILLEA